MKRYLKKLFIFTMAFTLLLSGAMKVPVIKVLADDAATAYICFADGGWAVQVWGPDEEGFDLVTADVTGYGQYTVSVDFLEAVGNNIAFFDVEISNGELLFPGSYMTIDSVKFNGEEVEVGNTYTSSDNGIATRTNLFNEWVSDITEGRTADGSTDVTSTPVSNEVGEVKTIEVTFTLGQGRYFDTPDVPEEGLSSYLCFADSGWAVQIWGAEAEEGSNIVANTAQVTGYGQYTVSVDFSDVDAVANNIAFFDVEIANGEIYFPNSYMIIDSVKINGEEVPVGKSYTSSDDGVATRTNLYNEWVSQVEKGRTPHGDTEGLTPVPVSNETGEIKTIEVTYTLTNGVPFGSNEEEGEDEDYVPPDEFNAFMMYSDGDLWQNFNPGVTGDMMIKGDGFWKVYTTAEQLGVTTQAVPSSSLVFLVDIEELGRAMKSIGTLRKAADDSWTEHDMTVKIEVYVDGRAVNVRMSSVKIGDLEGNGRLRLEINNAYGVTKDSPAVSSEVLNPEKEIMVLFSLEGTGFNTGASTVNPDPTPIPDDMPTSPPTPTPRPPRPTSSDTDNSDTGKETSTTTNDNDSDGLETWVIVLIVVGVVVISAVCIGVVMSKKKKGNVKSEADNKKDEEGK